MLWLPGLALACQPVIEQVWRAPGQMADTQAPETGWQPVTLPDLPTLESKTRHEVLWYRLDWQHDCQGQPLALNLDRMVMAGQIYLNGTLLWQDQYLNEPLSRSWNMPRYWLLPQSSLAVENSLLLRLVASAHPGAGLGKVHVGPPERLLPLYHTQLWLQRNLTAVNIAVSMLLSCLFLALWLLSRNEQAFGWFSLASLLWAIGLWNVLLGSSWPFPSGEAWDRISLIALILYCCAFCMFLWTFGGIRHERLSRPLWLAAVAVCLWIAIAPATQLLAMQALFLFGSRVLFAVISVQFLLHAYRTRRFLHRLLACCLLLFLLVNIYELLALVGLVSSENDYKVLSTPIMSICMFLIVAVRFAGSLRRIGAFNQELQMAIEQTRGELTRTLQREHQLEADNIRLNERLRLTHDLHDSMGSSLMRSILLTEKSTGMQSEQFIAILRELRDDLRHVIDGSSASASVRGGTPAEWIAPLRRRFVAIFDELELASTWQLPRQWPRHLDPTQRLALTRFLEEALTNVLKHSNASRLEIIMQALPDNSLSLSVADNGQGFDVVAAQGSGIGMNSMRLRIERIGGKLSVHSDANGTVLTATLKASSAEAAAPASYKEES